MLPPESSTAKGISIHSPSSTLFTVGCIKLEKSASSPFPGVLGTGRKFTRKETGRLERLLLLTVNEIEIISFSAAAAVRATAPRPV